MGNFGKKSSKLSGGGTGRGNNQNQPTPPAIRRRPAATVPRGTAVVAMDPAGQTSVGGRYPSGREHEFVALDKGVHINRETLKVERDQEDPEKYLVEFTYDAYVPGRIILHFYSKLRDESSEHLTKEDLITVDLPQGFGKKFRQESGSGIDFSSYKLNEREVYMLAIQAVGFACISEDGRMNSGTTAFQYTQATFDREEGECQVRVTYQSLHMNGVKYVLHDTYGIDIDGRLLVSGKEIGKGSNGTVVFEGIFEGRAVAVKRIVKVHHDDVALKEFENLLLSDQHCNIVRYYGVKCDQDFVYIVLERCVCSLDYLISPPGDSSVQPQPTMEVLKDLELWKPTQHPSPILLRLMRDIVEGLAYLHKLGIIHQDLKPQNVLIRKNISSIYAKVSDMGISKFLPVDKSSFTKSTTGSGSSGWQAPELLRNGRKTRAADLFSLGIVLFYCITRGRHPFGDDVSECDINIKNNLKKNLDSVNHLPEAHDLISRLLHPNPNSRPTAAEVYNHPLFWDPETRLSFIRDASDRVDLEDHGSKLQDSLESLQLYGNWNNKIDTILITDMKRYSVYDYNSVCHLLRAIRNKLNHYGETPENLKRVLGVVPMGFDGYFSSRFPKLLMDVYKVLKTYGVEGELLYKYYKHGQF